MKICLIGDLSVSFIKKDYEILKKHFDIEILQLPNKKFPSLEWIKFIFNLTKKSKRCDIAFSWFAGLHSAFTVFLFKLFKKKSIVVVGGWDAAFVPEINYGAFANVKEKVSAKYILKNADLLLPVSEFTKKEILENLEKAKPKKIKVVHNGVDTERFKSIQEKETNLVITVGGVSQLKVRRKGIDIFVESAKFISEARFVVIGKFFDDSIDYLKTIAPSNVEFTGFVSDSELVKWYQRAKVVCQLSYYEAFGLAPAEGMACGCIPVVTRERAGLPEFVAGTGFYAPYGNVKDTVESIKKALNASDEMGKKARERIVEYFSAESRKNNLVGVIEGLINEEKR